MIARFKVLLPFTLSVPQGENLTSHESRHDAYVLKIYPPTQATLSAADFEPVSLSSVSLRSVLDRLRPVDVQQTTEIILMDGTPTVQANLLQLDFIKSEFDRRRPEKPLPHDQGDPSIQFVFVTLNNFLARVRTLTRASQLRPLNPDQAIWRLDYLDDEGKELPHDPSLVRRRLAAHVQFRVCGINTEVWSKIMSLMPAFTPYSWDSLLLDAEGLLPDVGVSIVVAYSALENFISWSLDHLASAANLPPGLWRWINDRNQWYQEPSVKEQYDRLLQVFTGKSLKDQPKLWEAFQNLQDARNSFVHEGKAVIGKNKLEVTPKLARQLVVEAQSVVAWVENLLLEAVRRPQLKTKIEFTLQLRP